MGNAASHRPVQALRIGRSVYSHLHRNKPIPTLIYLRALLTSGLDFAHES